MTKGMALQQPYELVTGGGLSDATDARSTRRDNVVPRGNHEEADTRLIIHVCEEVEEGYERVLVISRDTDVLLILVHVMPTKPVEVWMISGTAKNRKCYPVHEASQRLTESVKTNLLSFHALTGCDTTSAFHSYGKKSCWKTFRNQPLLVAGIGGDGELAPIEQFVCHLYGRPEQSSVDQARLHLFCKAKKGLEMLPPTKDALELHTITCQLPGKYLTASRPATHTGLISNGHIGLDQRRSLPESSLDKATTDSGCLPGACDMWMQIQVQNGSMLLLQKGH